MPLAARVRPISADQFVGQDDAKAFLRSLLEPHQPLPSLVLWGPSGCGKTTWARILARARRDYETLSVSATSTGAPELRKLLEGARAQAVRGSRTLLFVDEIHRLTSPQQDVLLPYLEDGSCVLLGCTTENPSFALRAPVLSRSRVVVLHRHTEEVLVRLLSAALVDPLGLNSAVRVEHRVLVQIAQLADGDARSALNTLEAVAASCGDGRVVDEAVLKTVVQRTHLAYGEEAHHDLISALHKSIRGGDANAAVYYTMRMITAGDDPKYVARRLIRAASEDVGLANNSALPLAVAAYEACQKIGMPECSVNLCHAAAALALSPKSTHVYRAVKAVQQLVVSEANPAPPVHLRNAPTQLMVQLGYGHDYVYTPGADDEEAALAQEYLPAELHGSDWLHLDTLEDRADFGQQWKKKRKGV